MSDMPFNPAPYRVDLEGIDAPIHQIDQMILDLKPVIQRFVDLFTGDDPTRLACEKRAEMRGGTDKERGRLSTTPAKQPHLPPPSSQGGWQEDSKET